MLVVYTTSMLSVGFAVADTVVYLLPLCLSFVQLWYPIRYSGYSQKSWKVNLAAHLVMWAMLLSVSLSVSTSLLYFALPEGSTERAMLLASLPWRVVEGSLLYALIALTYYLYISITRLNEKAASELQLTKMLKESEINLLRSQINPHFLFNSLNSLSSLMLKDVDKAQEMLLALSDYLRYTVLAMRRDTSTLKEELENIKRYLAIEQLRFSSRLLYEIDVAESCLPLKLPSMLLQPLFENAVKHGVYESTEAVRIAAKVRLRQQLLRIEISNDFDPDAACQSKGSGTGLRNTQERLRLLYGHAAALQTKVEGSKFVVAIEMSV
jgi:sensor histidine kinase YesM